MRALALALGLLVSGLAGCGKPVSQEIAACHLEALKTYPQGPFKDIGDFENTCMAARGYEWNLGAKGCPAPGSNIFEDPACYHRKP